MSTTYTHFCSENVFTILFSIMQLTSLSVIVQGLRGSTHFEQHCQICETQKHQQLSLTVLLALWKTTNQLVSTKQFSLSFAHDVPKVQNELPDDIRSAKSLLSFKKETECSSLHKKPTHPRFIVSFNFQIRIRIISVVYFNGSHDYYYDQWK